MKHANRIRFATADLWAIALSLLGHLKPLLKGAGVMAPETWRRASAWLRDLEALARRILFAHAVVLAKTYKTPARTPQPLRDLQPRGGYIERRVRFRLGLFTRRRTINPWIERVVRPRDAPIYAASPLYERLCALEAVIDDPASHARRLARRIARQRHAVPDVLLRLRRRRPCRDLRPELGAAFREPMEILVARCSERRASPPRAGATPRTKTTVQPARRERTPDGKEAG